MATSSFNITPPNPDLWGTHVTNGYRVGTPAPSQNGFVPGQNNSVLLQNSAMGKLDQYGAGVFTSPIFTYRIRPGQCSNPQNNPDIYNNGGASTYPSSPENLPLTGSGSQPNAACAKILLNGQSALQFDVPRGISFNLYDVQGPVNTPATVVFNVYGLDFYLRPKTYQWTFTIPANASDQLALHPTIPFVYTTTQMFYVVTGVQFVSSTDTVSIVSYTLTTANRFGLPYRLDQAAHMIQYSQTDTTDSTLIDGTNQMSSNTIAYNVETSLNWPQAYLRPTAPANHTDVQTVFENTAIPTTSFMIGSATTPFDGGILHDGTLPIQCGANYRNPQSISSNDPLGYFTPNTSVSKPFTFNTSGAANILGYYTGTFWPGSTMTFTYYVAGADFYSAQMKAMQSWWANYGSDTTPLANLGYREYYNSGGTGAFGGNNRGGTGQPLEPPFQTGNKVPYINGIPDPYDVMSSKGATPYYEPQYAS